MKFRYYVVAPMLLAGLLGYGGDRLATVQYARANLLGMPFSVPSSGPALAFIGAADNAVDSGSLNSIVQNYSIHTGLNEVLLVGTLYGTTSLDSTLVTGAAITGAATSTCTRVALDVTGGAPTSTHWAGLWRCKLGNTSAGVATVTVTFNGSPAHDHSGICISEYANVDQTTPNDGVTPTTATGSTTVTGNLTTVTAGDWFVAVTVADGAITSGTGGTVRCAAGAGFYGGGISDSAAQVGGAGSHSMQLNNGGAGVGMLLDALKQSP